MTTDGIKLFGLNTQTINISVKVFYHQLIVLCLRMFIIQNVILQLIVLSHGIIIFQNVEELLNHL